MSKCPCFYCWNRLPGLCLYKAMADRELARQSIEIQIHGAVTVRAAQLEAVVDAFRQAIYSNSGDMYLAILALQVLDGGADRFCPRHGRASRPIELPGLPCDCP